MLQTSYISVFCLVLYSQCYHCFGLANEDLKRIDNLIESFMKCKNIPGLGLSIVKDGEAFSKGYGFSNIKTKDKFDGDTISCIGSTGKAFTVVLLGILLGEITNENKTYNWNTKVRDILGDEFRFSDEYRTSETTLIDILTHRTGLMTTEFLMLAGFPNENVTREELSFRFRYLPSRFQFRDQFLYDNQMYLLAGHIAEKIGGKSYERLLQEKILKPLGMNSAAFIDDIMTKPENYDFARPYRLEDSEFQESDRRAYMLRAFAPAGGLCASSADLTKWMEFLLHGGGTDDGVRLIDRTLFSEVPIPRMTLSVGFQNYLALGLPFPIVSTPVGYGLAWIVSNYRGHDMLQHGGNVHSYSAKATIFPQRGIGTFLSNNGPKPISLGTLSYAISDILLNETSWLDNRTICSYPGPWVIRGSDDKGGSVPSDSGNPSLVPENFEIYTGEYGHLLFGNVIVDVKDNKLHLSIGILMKGYLLWTDSPETFQMDFEEPFTENLVPSPKVIFSDKKNNVFNQVNVSSSVCGGEMFDFYRHIRYEDNSIGQINKVNPSSRNVINLNLISILFITVTLLI